MLALMTQVAIKRAYEKPSKSDGFRVLVDRLWPRGVSKTTLHIQAWAKDVAPSTELREWFGHDPERWAEFKRRYEHELHSAAATDALKSIIQQAHGVDTITLVYGAKDTEHNDAVVLRDVLERKLKSEHR